MLWTAIRDFFVEHVFGGNNSDWEQFDANVGFFDGDMYDGHSIYFKVGTLSDGSDYMTNLSDWLSTTATIITITLIVIACALFVYKIIRTIGGLIR